ncbi:hypothetical protein [Isoptericola sp. NPDC055881]
MDITEEQRHQLAELVREERERQFGTKLRAYQAASLNSATWDRVEAGASVRADRLRAALVTLWPWSDGDWSKVLDGPDAHTAQHGRGVVLDLDKFQRAFDQIRDWLDDAGDEAHPPTDALWLWTPRQLADNLAEQVAHLEAAEEAGGMRYFAELLHGKRVAAESFRGTNPFVEARPIEGTDEVILLSKRRLADDPDAGDYMLAARDQDDDAEVEAQQEEP